MDKPLLLIDIDGVISLFGFEPNRPPGGSFALVDGIAHFLSATAGDHLRSLSAAFEPVWCSGWEEKANDYLPAALGLPGPFPHLTFDRRSRRAGVHWKLDAIDAHAGTNRPLAWVDDAHDEECAVWASRRRAPTLLVGTDPTTGLTDAHVAQLLGWSRALTEKRSARTPAAGARRR